MTATHRDPTTGRLWPARADTWHHSLDIYETELHLTTKRAGWAAISRRLPVLAHDIGGVAGCSSSRVIPATNGGWDTHHVALYIDTRPARADSSNYPKLAGTVAHEATHAALAICDQRGLRVSSEADHDEEPYAYLVGWLSQWIWERVAT